MQVRCPYCNHLVSSVAVCETCGENIRWVEKVYEKSDAYYRQAYNYAKGRYLSDAITCLEKAIYFNKYHIQAKNLLGLIYLETGQVAMALKLWILSDALDKEDQEAVYYMNKLQENPRQLEAYKDSLTLYNRALHYLQKKNDDIAVIRLKKAIYLNPNFLEARNLLALCYLLQKQDHKALPQVQYVLKKDKNNMKALEYLRMLESKNMKQEESGKTISAPHINDLDISTDIQPQKVINRGSLFTHYILYFVFGAVCMLGIGVGLIVPSQTAALEKKVYDITAENASLKVEFDTFIDNAKIKEITLEGNNEKLLAENIALKQEHNGLMQINRLGQVEQLKEASKWVEAAEILNNISLPDLSSEQQKVCEELKKSVYPKAGDELFSLGTKMLKEEKLIEAMLQFEKVLIFVPDTKTAAGALYNMGQIEEKNNNIHKAVQFYNVVVEEYTDTSYYKKAKERVTKLASVNE
ncbi:MAG: tetratricopeptide repeat protein [Niameybacter sp.]